MTQEEKNIKIAEKCGWTHGNYNWFLNGVWQNASGPPDYFNDLNAMHDAEGVLTDEPRPQIGHSEMTCYVASLDELTNNEGWHATAAQRAEAFGKTLNLW